MKFLSKWAESKWWPLMAIGMFLILLPILPLLLIVICVPKFRRALNEIIREDMRCESVCEHDPIVS